jgi:hypothetical protein
VVKPNRSATTYLSGPTFSPNGKAWALITRENRVESVLDVTAGKEHPLPRENRRDDLIGGSFKFSSDGRTLGGEYSPPANSSKPATGEVRLWDVPTWRPRATLRGHSDRVTFWAFSPDGKMLATASWDETVRLWEVATGKPRATWKSGIHTVTVLAFSPDGKILATGGGRPVQFGERTPGLIRLWHIPTGKEVRTFKADEWTVCWVTFSPDGKLLAVWAMLRWFTIWDMSEITKSLSGHTPGGKQPPGAALEQFKLTHDQREALWSDLGGEDGPRAYRAVSRLAEAPQSAVSLLGKRLHSPQRPEPQRLSGLIADLDSDDFRTRENATRGLQNLGELTGPALRQAAAANPSAEVARRLEALLERLHEPPHGERLRGLRALEVLEHIGTAEAQRILSRLAAGPPEARLTEEAAASLMRLASPPRPAGKPKGAGLFSPADLRPTP